MGRKFRRRSNLSKRKSRISMKSRTMKRRMSRGGGYVLEDADIGNFLNIDIRDTLNETSVGKILDNSMVQHDINKHLLTGIITVKNLIEDKQKTHESQIEELKLKITELDSQNKNLKEAN